MSNFVKCLEKLEYVYLNYEGEYFLLYNLLFCFDFIFIVNMYYVYVK